MLNGNYLNIFIVVHILFHLYKYHKFRNLMKYLTAQPLLTSNNKYIICFEAQHSLQFDSTKEISETDRLLYFLIYNTFVTFGGRVFSINYWHSNGNHLRSLLADLFLYSYESNIIQELLRNDVKCMNMLLTQLFYVAIFNYLFTYVYIVFAILSSTSKNTTSEIE